MANCHLHFSTARTFHFQTNRFLHWNVRIFLPRMFQRKSWNWNGWSGIPHVPSTVLCLHARFQTRQNQFDELLAPTIHVLYVLRRFRNECLRKYTSTTAFTVFQITYPTTIVWRTQFLLRHGIFQLSLMQNL